MWYFEKFYASIQYQQEILDNIVFHIIKYIYNEMSKINKIANDKISQYI